MESKPARISAAIDNRKREDSIRIFMQRTQCPYVSTEDDDSDEDAKCPYCNVEFSQDKKVPNR
jgi:hypothetical protein